MDTANSKPKTGLILALLNGRQEPRPGARMAHEVEKLILTVVLGAGLYGTTIGIWRSPLQALYAGIKFPLVILLTVLATAAANGMLAQVIGLDISWRESFRLVLRSFAAAALILAGMSPVLLFVMFNAPPLQSPDTELAYHIVRLAHVGTIALAGIAANIKCYQLLYGAARSQTLARRILVVWLTVNLFVGAQLSWTMRPFIGTPYMEVRLFREHPLRGNFYEEVYRSLNGLAGTNRQ